MKPIRILLPLIILLMFASAAGCAATPQDRWYQQREALNTANQIYLANVPQMDDQEIVQRGQLLQAARNALAEAHAHLPDGGSGFDSALDVVESLLVQLAAPPMKADTSAATAVPDASTTCHQGEPHDPR